MPAERCHHPAFRAWLLRLLGYTVVAWLVVVAAAAAFVRWVLPDSAPGWVLFLAAWAVAMALNKPVTHVVMTLLHERREAAYAELEAELGRRVDRG